MKSEKINLQLDLGHITAIQQRAYCIRILVIMNKREMRVNFSFVPLFFLKSSVVLIN